MADKIEAYKSSSNPQDGGENKPSIRIFLPNSIESSSSVNQEKEALKANKMTLEMENISKNRLSIPIENSNVYSEIYKKKSSFNFSHHPPRLQSIDEDPRGSLTESVMDNFSLDQYDCKEQEQPSQRPSSDSYQLKKPKSSLILASGLCFHMEDILEVREDSIMVKMGDGQTESISITNHLTHSINRINQYYKKPVIFKPLYSGINTQYAWLLLLLGTLANGIIPAWIQYIPAEKYLRIAWRFFMQFFMMIPFAMYEKRNGDDKIKDKYKLSYILRSDNLQKIFLCSFTMCTWFAFTLFCFEWTYVSQAIILGNLVNFYLFILRVVRKEQIHYIEIFGAIIVFSGVLCVLLDSITFDPHDLAPSTFTYKMKKFAYRENWQRLIFGNGTSLLVSFLMAKMVKHQSAAKEVFPPYLFSLLTSFLNTLNMTVISYFLSGVDFINDPFWGWYGLFSTDQFSSFFLMSILLGMGSFISMNLINKIFEPLVPSVAQLFEPVISTVSLQVLGVQIIPMGLSCLGYALILPGLLSIILGQYFIQQYKKDKK